MGKQHQYAVKTTWQDKSGEGTKDYRTYSRSHAINAKGKPIIEASSDPLFRGDKLRYNPEELLVASLSSCHMLWYLHLCADAGIVVTNYEDNATGTMEENASGGGQFKEVILHPTVTVTQESMGEKATTLHVKAHELCFIANSVNFVVKCEGTIVIAE